MALTGLRLRPRIFLADHPQTCGPAENSRPPALGKCYDAYYPTTAPNKQLFVTDLETTPDPSQSLPAAAAVPPASRSRVQRPCGFTMSKLPKKDEPAGEFPAVSIPPPAFRPRGAHRLSEPVSTTIPVLETGRLKPAGPGAVGRRVRDGR